MQRLFTFLADPKNQYVAIWSIAITIIAVLTTGAVLGVLYCARKDKQLKQKKEQYRFDHSVQQPMRIVKKRKL